MMVAPVADNPGIDWPAIIQDVLLLAGGLWAFYLYRKSRKGQAAIALNPTVRLVEHPDGGGPVLLVGLRVSNTSGVVFRHVASRVDLMDASARVVTDPSRLQVVRFATQDPFLAVYGYQSEDPQEIALGRSFWYHRDEPIQLEPGEVVDCDLAFPLLVGRGLLAVYVLIQGYQGRGYRWKVFKRIADRRPWIWSSYMMVDLASLGPREHPRLNVEWYPRTGGRR